MTANPDRQCGAELRSRPQGIVVTEQSALRHDAAGYPDGSPILSSGLRVGRQRTEGEHHEDGRSRKTDPESHDVLHPVMREEHAQGLKATRRTGYTPVS